MIEKSFIFFTFNTINKCFLMIANVGVSFLGPDTDFNGKIFQVQFALINFGNQFNKDWMNSVQLKKFP